jgi:hypothetical protein
VNRAIETRRSCSHGGFGNRKGVARRRLRCAGLLFEKSGLAPPISGWGTDHPPHRRLPVGRRPTPTRLQIRFAIGISALQLFRRLGNLAPLVAGTLQFVCGGLA